MNFVQIMANTCDPAITSILSLVKLFVNAICVIVPIVLIILTILDIAKIVTAGNLDDKLKKEVMNKITTRLIYSVLIFLVPTIVTLLFNLLGRSNATIGNSTSDTSVFGATWSECWQQA